MQPVQRRAPVGLAVRVFAIVAVLLVALAPLPAWASDETLLDYPIPAGHFFSQAGGGADRGYSITDVDGALFYSAFVSLGGVEALGYPVSRRFEYGGFISQATQKAVLQWRPDRNEVVFLNVLDELDRLGQSEFLRQARLIPLPLKRPDEAGMSFDAVVQARLSWLDEYPAIQRAYFSVPRAVERRGLPTSRPTDLGDVVVLRAQRAVIQQWKVDVPWAKAGEVVLANVGDLAKELSLVPASAARAEDPAAIIVADTAPRFALPAARLAAIQERAQVARASVVKVTSIGVGTGTGILVDAVAGTIVTNSHVVYDGRRYRVTYSDGEEVTASLVGADPLSDLAVLRVPPSRRPSLTLGDSDRLAVGDVVFALGFPPSLPRQPALTVGDLRGFVRTRTLGGERLRNDIVLSTTALFPGNSGGPLLTLDGHVVGINSAVIQRRDAPTTRTSVSIAANVARPLVEQILAFGRVRRPYLGIVPRTVTLSLAAELKLAIRSGVYVVRVEDDSPAARAGLRPGDVITTLDDAPIDDVYDLRAALDVRQAGATVVLEINRDGVWRTLSIKLGDSPGVVAAGSGLAA